MKQAPPSKRFAFYRRLSPEQKSEYDRSDRQRHFGLVGDPALGAAANQVVAALGSESRAATARGAQRLVDAICRRLAPRHRPPTVKLLRTRPRTAENEFHGLYTLFSDGTSDIKVWMFTAAHGQVVKPRTFLRTLLHEVCHHLDMTLFDLSSSLHTMGFHARESSLLRVLEQSGASIPGRRVQGKAAVTGEGVARTKPKPPRKAAARARPPSATPTAPGQSKPVQLELFRT